MQRVSNRGHVEDLIIKNSIYCDETHTTPLPSRFHKGSVSFHYENLSLGNVERELLFFLRRFNKNATCFELHLLY